MCFLAKKGWIYGVNETTQMEEALLVILNTS
jgi:hypothetical protein